MRSTSWQNLMVFVFIGATTVLHAEELLFERDIAPILEEHCWHCHGEDEQESGLRLDRRAGMLRGETQAWPLWSRVMQKTAT